MFTWAIVFLIIALIAGLFGFTGIAGTAVGFAKIVFAVALILLVISLISGGLGIRPTWGGTLIPSKLQKERTMFERIKLPYDYKDLEPYIDRETVKTHYEGHHKTYMEKFNALVVDIPAFKRMQPLEILRNLDKAPADKKTALKNNGGGFYNHNLYFESLTPDQKKPSGPFEEAVIKTFGSFDVMLEKLHKAATETLFGSGYAWLITRNGALEITVSANQDVPDGGLLLPIDMWEHAYYLKHKNKKADHVKDLFRIINWDVVAKRFELAK